MPKEKLSEEEKRERHSEQMKKYYEKNKQKIRSQQKDYYEKNKEGTKGLKERNRRYYLEHKDEILAKRRIRYAEKRQ